MANATGKIKGQFTEQKDALLGAVVISGVVGVVAGILAFLAGGIGWALGCGITAFFLLGSVVIYSLLSDTHGPPTEGDVNEQGYRHGRWIWKNDDGQLLREDNYVHGVKDGLQIRWHENGNKHQEIPYRNGKLHGTWTDWYENGSKEEVDNYDDGRKKGQHVEWYESGQKKKECCFHDDDVPHGDWTTWHENGEKQIEAHFEYGTPVETWTERDSKGLVLCQRDFKAGIQYGKGRRYFSEITEPQTACGNVVVLIVAVAAFAFATYQQIQSFSWIFTLFVVVFIHELGHFLAAKLVGIPISHFVVGTGPRLFGFHLGPTSYELKLLPIMGHVKAYELRRQEFEQPDVSPNIQPSEPQESTIEFVSRPRRLVFFLAGVVFNFATVMVIAIIGYTLRNPESGFSESISGAFAAIWALTPVFGNTKEYMSGFAVLMATGLECGSIGLISLLMVCFNLLPIPPLDGFHIMRVSIATLIRREVPQKYLLPLQAAGVCLVAALLVIETVFIAGGVVSGVKSVFQEVIKPSIIGQPETVDLFDGPVIVSFDDEERSVPSEGKRLLALTFQIDGEQTLLSEEYAVIATGSSNQYQPVGILFERRNEKSVFRDRREAERVELSHARGPEAFYIGLDSKGITSYTLVEPVVTLLYEVANDDRSFELHYDGTTVALPEGE